MRLQDAFGTERTVSRPETITAWNCAMSDYLGFRGSPVGDVQDAHDPGCISGFVFCAAMKLLGGLSPQGPSVSRDLAAIRDALPDATPTEKLHANAVMSLAAGEPSAAARDWDRVLAQDPHDILAHKCAHEVWFHIGGVSGMHASAKGALDRLHDDDPCFATAAAQYGFALEESGELDAAEHWGKRALEIVPSDLWAMHCLAHIFETQNRHSEALSLIEEKKTFWKEQNLLSAHIWWHLALRLVEAEDFDAALAIYDDMLADVPASNQFRLTDGTSLLWRLELAGVDVGARWRGMADLWAVKPERHACAFLEMHSAMAFARCPDHSATEQFFGTLETAFSGEDSELARAYAQVVKPLARAIRSFPGDPQAAAKAMAPLLPQLHVLGGSIVQREVVERSYTAALIRTNQPDNLDAYLSPKSAERPTTPWLLRGQAEAAGLRGDAKEADMLFDQANAAFA